MFEPSRAADERTPGGLIAYGLPVSLAVLCGLTLVARKSLWFDEALTAQAARLPLRDLLRFLTQEAAPVGLYYGVMHAWAAMGTGELVLRLFSTVWFVGSVALLVSVGTRLFDRRAGLFAGLALAVNAFFVSYAQEARVYTLAVFLCIVATVAFGHAVEGERRRWWLVYGILAAVAIYAHTFSGLVVLAHAASLFSLPRERRPWRRLGLAAGVAAVLVAPLVALAASQPSLVGWVSTPSLRSVLEFLRLAGGISVLGAMVYAVAIAMGIRARRGDPGPERRWRLALVVAWSVVPPVVALAVSFVQPVFVPRYLLVGLPGVALLVGLGIASLRGRLAAIAAAVLIAGSAIGLRTWYLAPPRQPWRSTVAFIAANDQSGDGLVPVGRAGAGSTAYLPAVSLGYYGVRYAPTLAAEAGDLSALQTGRPLPATRTRVWLVVLRNLANPGQDADERATVESALAAQGFRAGPDRIFEGSQSNIEVVLYTR